MASHKNKSICFLHVPKCSGMSIKGLFNRNTELFSWPYGHQKASSIKPRPDFIFSFVRNPWDRVVSAYFFLLQGGIRNKQDLGFQKQILQYPSFRNFVLQEGWRTQQAAPHQPKRMYYNRRRNHTILHFLPCCYFLDIEVDFVGKVENLNADIELLCKKLSLPPCLIPTMNKSKHKHYTEYYDDETREIVAEKYAKDIKRFGYEFGE